MMRAVALVSFLLLVPLTISGVAAQNAIIETVAGGGPENMPSTAPLIWPISILAGSSGEIYVVGLGTPSYLGRVFRIDPSGMLGIVAGNGLGSPWGDGGPATAAGLGIVYAMVQDPAGNLFIAEWGGRAIRRIDAATGAISTVAGGGASGGTQDGIPAAEAFIGFPHGLAFDAAGNLCFSQEGGHKVRVIDAVTGLLGTVAGNGTAGFGGDGGPATSAMLDTPREIAFDAAGNLYIADSGNRRVRKVEAATGNIVTVAGSGNEGFEGDGGPATAANFFNPSGLAVDASGNIYVSDWWETGDGPIGGRVRRIEAATGIITLAAGGGSGGQSGGIQATDATMYQPRIVDLDPNGDILVADYGNDIQGAPWNSRAWRVESSSGLIFAVADGSGSSFGDGGAAADAVLDGISGAALDAAGNLFVATGARVVRRIDAVTGIITLYAGDRQGGLFCGDGGPATQACLWQNRGLALDAAGDLFIADTGNDRIRRVDAATGIITTYAGNGTSGYDGDNKPATMASLNSPNDVALDDAGNLYVADMLNNRVRIVTVQPPKINTFAGDGTEGYAGDGGPATAASLNRPTAVAFDPAGRLLIADKNNFRIRSVDLATEIITTVAGDGTQGFGGDGGPATLAQISGVGALAVEADGSILISDNGNSRIRRVDALTGNIDTVAGNGISGFSGDGGLATLAQFRGASGLAAGAGGDFFFGDSFRIRRVSETSQPTAAGEVPDGDPAFGAPVVVAHAPLGQVTLSWDASCVAPDSDYEVYSGTLGSFTSHAPWICSTGGATSVTIAPDSGDAYYMIVPRSFASEGSYGRDSAGVERPPAMAACIPQEIAACP